MITEKPEHNLASLEPAVQLKAQLPDVMDKFVTTDPCPITLRIDALS